MPILIHFQEQEAGKEGASLGDRVVLEVPRKQAAKVDTALKVPLALSLSPLFSLAVSLSLTHTLRARAHTHTHTHAHTHTHTYRVKI